MRWLGSALRWDKVSDHVNDTHRRLCPCGLEDLESSRPAGLTHSGQSFLRLPNSLDAPLSRIAGVPQQSASDQTDGEWTSGGVGVGSLQVRCAFQRYSRVEHGDD
jgi:hypothetical protein